MSTFYADFYNSDDRLGSRGSLRSYATAGTSPRRWRWRGRPVRPSRGCRRTPPDCAGRRAWTGVGRAGRLCGRRRHRVADEAGRTGGTAGRCGSGVADGVGRRRGAPDGVSACAARREASPCRRPPRGPDRGDRRARAAGLAPGDPCRSAGCCRETLDVDLAAGAVGVVADEARERGSGRNWWTRPRVRPRCRVQMTSCFAHRVAVGQLPSRQLSTRRHNTSLVAG